MPESAPTHHRASAACVTVIFMTESAIHITSAAYLLWRKYGRSYPTEFDGTYYRELPSEYSPAELSVLWNYKQIQAHDLTATILDLARRRFISIEEERQEIHKLLGSKEVKTYRLTFPPAPEPASLFFTDGAP